MVKMLLIERKKQEEFGRLMGSKCDSYSNFVIELIREEERIKFSTSKKKRVNFNFIQYCNCHVMSCHCHLIKKPKHLFLPIEKQSDGNLRKGQPL